MSNAHIDPEEIASLVETGSAAQTDESTSSHMQSPDEREVTVRPAQFTALEPRDASSSINWDLLLGVTLRITVELGRTKMTIGELMKLGPGAIVELDKMAGEPVDVLAGGRPIAKGEVVVIDDRFGVRITEVLPPSERVKDMDVDS